MKFIHRILVFVMVFMLVGCSSSATSSSKVLPTVAMDEVSVNTARKSSGIIASGVVVAKQQADLAFTSGGTVEAINIKVGDTVQAGDVLITLETNQAELAVQQATANLASAQATYDKVAATTSAQIQANITSAESALLEANNAMDNLVEDAQLVAAQAQLEVANAEDALDEAQDKRRYLDSPRANETTLASAQAWYDLKEEELAEAKKAYENVEHLPSTAPERQSALVDLDNAQDVRDDAWATLNWYLNPNTDQQIAKAEGELAVAQAKLAIAQAEYEKVKDGPSAADLAQAQARIDAAQAQVELAKAQSADVDLASAQAGVDAARTQLELAQKQLDAMTIRAPFSGVIASVNVEVGEWISLGQSALTLVDMAHLRIKTTDLSELDVVNVSIGEPVTVSVEALNIDISGVVSVISPLSSTLGGDVVYETTIDLDEIPDGLYVGMSVEVQFTE